MTYRIKEGFPPIIEANSRILILGTMPGEESLKRRQYYAYPRNQFWRILADIYQAQLAEDYSERKEFLRQHQLALWDVLEYCERDGSLDQNIRNAVPNNFGQLFKDHRNLRALIFNGQKACNLFEKKVLRQQNLEGGEQLPRLLMPSTSPAGTMPLAEKIKRWRKIRDL